MEDKATIGQIILTTLILCIFIVPPMVLLVRRASRTWVQGGIEGENKRLDLPEIWEMIYMFIAICSFLLVVYMIINKTIYKVEYNLEEYLVVFIGTLGSNAAAILITYFKNKYPATKN